MSELKQLVAQLMRGEQSFEVVSRALAQLVANSPERAADAAKLLRAARDTGLPHHLFAALNGQLDGPIRAGGNPDATLLAADDPDVTVFADDDADATRFTPDAGDALMQSDQGGKRAAPGNSDPNATLLAGHDATRLDAPAGAYARTTELDAPLVPAESNDGDLLDPFSGKTASGASVPGDDSDMQGAAAGASTRVGEKDGLDIFSADAMTAAARAAEAQTRGANWSTATQPPAAVSGPRAGIDREFHEGDLLRGRFELIAKLGEGGMGAVWKGKDKLKEEARDRNPYVAIKLLQGDFKSHPEAFIALQRETAKQQRLAHPNIATVFDFDRDDATGTVFMTMEVLEGQPLDAFIRKIPADGLTEEEAMPLIVQLCAGLSYAHQAGLVHSDLKPGNCFLTREGSIKLLDFGIARASKTKADAEGETTLFDPGQLGALTPTYATIEMFDGVDPDQRDDIYSLAIMSYQLLTGKHPYGKKSAPKAKELGLVPEPVAKLGKRENNGLIRGLALLREDRAGSVEEFLDSITRKKSRAGLWVGSGIAATVLIGFLAYTPIMDALDTSRRERVIAAIEQPRPDSLRAGLEQASALGPRQLARVLEDPRVIDAAAAFIARSDGANVEQGLALLANYPPEWAKLVKDVELARRAIFDHFNRRIVERFSPENARYDFPAAQAILARLDGFYPDSAQVFQLRSSLDEAKNSTLADLGEKYKELLAARALVPVEGAQDIADVLAVVRQIDDQDFEAPQLLARAYERLAKTAAENDDFLNAAKFAQQGLELHPGLETLAGALQGYEQQITKRERELRLHALFNSLDAIDVSAVQQDLAGLKADFPQRFDAMVERFANARAAQLRSYSRARDVDVGVLAARSNEFETLFPRAGAALATELADAVEPGLRGLKVDSPQQLRALSKPLADLRALSPQRHAALFGDLAANALSAVRALEQRDKAAAATLLRAAKSAFPGHREIAALDIVVPLPELASGLTQMQRGQLAAAASSLAGAKSRDAAHPDISPFESQLNARRRQADDLYAQHVAKARDPLGHRVKDDVRALFRQALAACSDCGYQERVPEPPPAGLCHAGLAGFGGQRAGECFDMVGRTRGPTMVVVPAGGGNAQPFAIGKYEVSQRDFGLFCRETNKCKAAPASRNRLPVTEIPAQLMEDYAAWLSQQARAALQQTVLYRLPTSAEWDHAANANGAQPEKNFNCTVTSGGRKIAGFDLLDATSGQPNGWGLTNYVGNAQELVRSGGSYAARGGDFDVPLTRCDASLSQPHTGAPDKTTGFRLVRELG